MPSTYGARRRTLEVDDFVEPKRRELLGLQGKDRMDKRDMTLDLMQRRTAG